MTDERDPKVSHRYRQLGAEEPSGELDRNIVSAARRAAHKPHAPLVTPAGRHRWYFAFGAAAIVVLAVTVAVHMERERPDAEALGALPSPPQTGESPASEQPSDAARADVHRQPEERKAPAADAAQRAAKIKEAPSEQSRAAEPPAAPAAAAPPYARAERPAPSAGAMVPMIEPPERWLERIAQLRKDGRHDEADRQLAEFRRQYPDYKIPEAALK